MLTQLLPGPIREEASVGDVCFLQAYMQNLSLLELGKFRMSNGCAQSKEGHWEHNVTGKWMGFCEGEAAFHL